MKRRLLSGILVLSLLATGCIKTVESDGVKTMRTSQAALLTAMAGATTTNATADAALKAAQATYQSAMAAKTNADAEIAKAESAAKLATQKITDATLVENNRSLAAMNVLKEALQAANDAKTKASLTEAIKVEQANTAYQLKVIENNLAATALSQARTKETDRNFAAMNALAEALKAATDAQTIAALKQKMAAEAAQSELNLKQIAMNLENAIAAQENTKAANAANLIYSNQQLLLAKQQLEQTQRQYELTAAQAKIEQAKQIELLKITAANAKNSVATSLINEYNNSFNLWSNTNNNIISYNQFILSQQNSLKLAEIDGPAFVSFIKNRLDAQKITVAQRTTDLERASLPADKLKAEYEAEIAALKLELPTLNATYDAAYAENQKTNDAYLSANDAYAKASSLILATDLNSGYSGSIGSTYDSQLRINVYTGKTAAFAKADRDMIRAEPDTATAHDNYFHNLSWNHIKYIGSTPALSNWVTLQNAVAAEKSDTTATGAYTSVEDAAHVTLAGEAAKAALDKYNAAIATYRTVLAAWYTAKTANDAAFVTLNSLYKTLDTANKAYAQANTAYTNAMTVFTNKKSRLAALESSLATLANPLSIQSAKAALADATVVLDKWTAIYDSAVKALADGTSFSYSNNGSAGSWAGLASYLDQIKDNQASLIIEQAKLVKYKADMDNWAAQVAAALAS